MSLAAISVAGFILRWIWMMQGSALAGHRTTRILPHILDTLFLASGVALAFLLAINPLAHTWLTVKLAGLAAYIVLASMAYKHARQTRTRVLLFLLALLVFAWTVSIARLKHPLGFFSLAGF